MTASPRDDFHDEMAASLTHNRITRRQALWLLGAGSSAVALQGCAYSPVTGEPILVGMSEAQERSTDTQLAPHQFSQDLGEVQDPALNRYVSDVGNRLARRQHRPQSRALVRHVGRGEEPAPHPVHIHGHTVVHPQPAGLFRREEGLQRFR